MKRYNKLGVAAAAGVIAFLVMAAVAFGDTGSEDCIPIVTTDDTDEVGEDEQMDYGGKWLEEQSELYDIGTKYGCDDIAERPKIEKVGGMYWRYAAYKYGGICVLTFSPQEFKDDDDMGGDYSGEIALPETLGGKTVVQIGWRLFNGKSVSSVVIPPGALVSFDDGFENRFGGCSKLVKFVVTDDHPSYSVRDGFLCNKSGKKLLFCPAGLEGDVVIPDGIEEIGEHSFSGCNKIASLAIPPSVRKVRSGLGYGCPKLRAVHVRDLSAWCRIDFEYVGMFCDDSRFQMSNPLCSAHNLYMDGKLVTDLEIPADVESIGMMAFAGCTSLRSVVVPGSVTNIGAYAFGDCSVLEKVEIREGVKSIEDGAFANCIALREIAIPDTVTTVGSPADAYAMDECGAFKFCTSLRRATLPKTLREIPKGLFMECRRLREVEMPKDLEVIGDAAFFKCIDLQEIEIPQGVKRIGGKIDQIKYFVKGPFLGCTSLQTIEIPDSVEVIGHSAFGSCVNLEKVKIGSKVRVIGSGAFANCVNLSSVVMSPELSDLGAGAFHNCPYLKFDDRSIPGFKMRNGVVVERTAPLGETLDLTGTKGISDNAIGGRRLHSGQKVEPELEKLRRIIFPEGYKAIKFDVFSGCPNLCEFSIPSSVTEIHGDIRRLWKHFDKVEISDIAAWSRIDFDVEVAVPCQHCVPGHPGVVVGSSNPLGIGAELLLDGKPVTELVIPGTVERIGEGAFFGYGQLKSVVIEEGVKEIGPFAFYGCTNLVSRKIANSVTNIGDRAFGKRMKREHNFPY